MSNINLTKLLLENRNKIAVITNKRNAKEDGSVVICLDYNDKTEYVLHNIVGGYTEYSMMNFCGQYYNYKIEHQNYDNEKVLYLCQLPNPEDYILIPELSNYLDSNNQYYDTGLNKITIEHLLNHLQNFFIGKINPNYENVTLQYIDGKEANKHTWKVLFNGIDIMNTKQYEKYYEEKKGIVNKYTIKSYNNTYAAFGYQIGNDTDKIYYNKYNSNKIISEGKTSIRSLNLKLYNKKTMTKIVNDMLYVILRYNQILMIAYKGDFIFNDGHRTLGNLERDTKVFKDYLYKIDLNIEQLRSNCDFYKSIVDQIIVSSGSTKNGTNADECLQTFKCDDYSKLLSTTDSEKLFNKDEKSEIDHLFTSKDDLMNRWNEIKDIHYVKHLPKLDLKKLVNILIAHKLKIESLGSNRDHLTKEILNASPNTNLNSIVRTYISKNYSQNLEINNLSKKTLQSIINYNVSSKHAQIEQSKIDAEIQAKKIDKVLPLSKFYGDKIKIALWCHGGRPNSGKTTNWRYFEYGMITEILSDWIVTPKKILENKGQHALLIFYSSKAHKPTCDVYLKIKPNEINNFYLPYPATDTIDDVDEIIVQINPYSKSARYVTFKDISLEDNLNGYYNLAYCANHFPYVNMHQLYVDKEFNYNNCISVPFEFECDISVMSYFISKDTKDKELEETNETAFLVYIVKYKDSNTYRLSAHHISVFVFLSILEQNQGNFMCSFSRSKEVQAIICNNPDKLKKDINQLKTRKYLRTTFNYENKIYHYKDSINLNNNDLNIFKNKDFFKNMTYGNFGLLTYANPKLLDNIQNNNFKINLNLENGNFCDLLYDKDEITKKMVYNLCDIQLNNPKSNMNDIIHKQIKRVETTFNIITNTDDKYGYSTNHGFSTPRGEYSTSNLDNRSNIGINIGNDYLNSNKRLIEFESKEINN